MNGQQIKNLQQIWKPQTNEDHVFVKNNSVQTSTSFHFKQYHDFFSSSINKENDVQQMHLKLRQEGFFIYQEQVYEKSKLKQREEEPQLKVTVNPRSQTWEIVQLQCQLGVYKKTFLVYNFDQESESHKLNLFSNGSMGKIYNYVQPKNEINVIFKCIPFKPQFRQNASSILITLRQYFIATMMSALQIGPKIKKFLGFDLIINKDCLEFAMQKCRQLKQEQFNESEKVLKNSLRRMHLLKIVHLDIKPQNIMFSQIFNKAVFIDFGLSEMIQQNIGFKTLTSFKGTVAYCSKQMFKSLKSKCYVDLYMNDLEGFKIFLEDIELQLLEKKTRIFYEVVFQNNCQTILQKKRQFQNFSLKILLRFYLFKQKINEAKTIFFCLKNQSLENQNLQKQLLKFCIKIQPSESIWNFCHTNLTQIYKFQKQYKEFLKRYNKKSRYTHYADQNQTILSSLYGNYQKSYKWLYQKIIQSNGNDKKLQTSFLITKAKSRQYLLKQPEQVNFQRYFFILVKYISFFNNSFRTDIYEKYEVSCHFLNCFKKTFVNDAKLNSIISQFKIASFNNKNLSKELNLISQSLINLISIITDYKFQSFITSSLILELAKQMIAFDFSICQTFKFFYQQAVDNQQNLLIKITNCFNLHSMIDIYDIKLKRFNFFTYQQTKRIEQLNNILIFPRKVYEKYRDYFQQLKNNKIHLKFKHLFQQRFMEIIFQLQILTQTRLKKMSQNRNFIQQSFNELQFILSQNQNKLQCNQMACFTQILMSLKQHWIFLEFQINFTQSYLIQSKFSQKHKSYFNKTPFKFFIIDLKTIQMVYNMKCFTKLKIQLQTLDIKINFSQVSNTFYPSIRLALAYIEHNQTKVQEFTKLIFSNQNVDFRNQTFILETFTVLDNFCLDLFMSIQELNPKFKEWIHYSTDKLTEQLLKISQQKVLILQYNFVMRLSYWYYKFYQFFQFPESLRNEKIFQRISQINLRIKQQMYRFLYYESLDTYYATFEKDISKRLSVIFNIFNEQQTSKYHYVVIDFQNYVYLIFQVISIKRLLIQDTNLFSYSDYLIVYKRISKQDYAVLFMSDYIQQFLFRVLLTEETIQQVIRYLLNLLYHLQNNPSWQNSRIFIKFLNQSFYFCECDFCQLKKSKLMEISFIFNALIKQKKVKVWRHSYLSLYLLKSLSIQIDRQVKLKALYFIGQTFQYLNKETKSHILDEFYMKMSQIFSDNKYKRNFLFKKHLKVTSKKYFFSYLQKFYLRKSYRTNQYKNFQSIHQQFYIQKLKRMHQIQENIKTATTNENIKVEFCTQKFRFCSGMKIFLLSKPEKLKLLNYIEQILSLLNK